VRETQRNDHAPGANPPPTVGEVPEQHVQADFHAGVLGNGRRSGQGARALERLGDEPTGQLRIAGETDGGLLVEHRDPRLLQHAPAGGARERRLHAFPLPRAKEIALAQKLGAAAAVDAHATDQQPTQHQQPDSVRSHIGLLSLPAAAW
jgi:hypothetical protein